MLPEAESLLLRLAAVSSELQRSLTGLSQQTSRGENVPQRPVFQGRAGGTLKNSYIFIARVIYTYFSNNRVIIFRATVPGGAGNGLFCLSLGPKNSPSVRSRMAELINSTNCNAKKIKISFNKSTKSINFVHIIELSERELKKNLLTYELPLQTIS